MKVHTLSILILTCSFPTCGIHVQVHAHTCTHTHTHTLSSKLRDLLMTLFSNPQLKRNNHVPTSYPPLVPQGCPRSRIEHTFLSYAISTQQYNQIRSRMGETGQMIHFPCPSTSWKIPVYARKVQAMLGHYLGHNEVFRNLNYNSSAYTVLLVESFESWLPI